MPEMQSFDDRLEAAVHAFADRAQTSVDAVAMAGRAMRHRRAGRLAWLGAAVPVPMALLIVLALLVLALAATLGMGVGRDQPAVLPVPTASPTAAPSASPTATPSPDPATDGKGDEVIGGTQAIELTTPYATTIEGDVTHLRGGVITTTASTSDPRTSGTGTWQVSADLRSAVGPLWGRYRIENAGGAWDGDCSGSASGGGTPSAWSCWLTGSDAYDGFFYYLSATPSGPGTGDVRGVITPGLPRGP